MKAVRVWMSVWCLVWLAACNHQAEEAALPAGSVVLALGDSLTAGVGADKDGAWPALLAAQSGWEVINAGVSGDDSAQALARLPPLLAEHNPALVLVCIGGNDFLRRQALQSTRDNVEAILRLLQAQGSRVVLIAVPAPGLGAALGLPADHPLYAELAEKYGVLLLEGAWGAVMRDSALMADQVHPNARGYARFSDSLRDFLQRKGVLN